MFNLYVTSMHNLKIKYSICIPMFGHNVNVPCQAQQSQWRLSFRFPLAVHAGRRGPTQNGRSWTFAGWRVVVSQSGHETRLLHCRYNNLSWMSHLIYKSVSGKIHIYKDRLILGCIYHFSSCVSASKYTKYVLNRNVYDNMTMTTP